MASVFPEQALSRVDSEIDDIILEEGVENSHLDHVQVLEYLHRLKSFANAVGVPEQDRKDYVQSRRSMEDSFTPGELEQWVERYGSVPEAVTAAEQELSVDPDSRYDFRVREKLNQGFQRQEPDYNSIDAVHHKDGGRHYIQEIGMEKWIASDTVKRHFQ